MENYLLCTVTVLELNFTHIQLECQSQHNITLSYACSHTYFTAICIHDIIASQLAKSQMQSRLFVLTSHRLVHSFQNYVMMLLNMLQWSVYHRQLVQLLRCLPHFSSLSKWLAIIHAQQHRKCFLITTKQCVRTIFQGDTMQLFKSFPTILLFKEL